MNYFLSIFKKNPTILFVFSYFFINPIYAQANFTGVVKDEFNNPIKGANVLISSNYNTITNEKGLFYFENIKSSDAEITISHLGFKTLKQSVSFSENSNPLVFILEKDLLQLQTIVVTGTFNPRVKIETSTAVSTLVSKNLKQSFNRGTADLLQLIPGTFTDASAGEVFTRVYNRGVSASAEDDLGWYYVSLQEDGLPVSLVQHSYYAPDLFHRLDLMTYRVEAIRGGKASITALNAPGGIYNFISQGRKNQFGGEIQLQSGFQGDGNPFHRIDAQFGAPLGNNWFFNAGGHYRYDDGARNTDFTFGQGGQFKFNVIKENSRGYFKFYGKILDDKTNRWTGVAATNWGNPQAAFGQDFRTTSLLMPSFNTNIPDGRNLSSGATNKFNPSQGVYAKDLAFGIDLLQDLGNNWSLKYNFKLSTKDANWQTSISNAFVSLSNPLAYFISDTSGSTFPIGQVVFRDARNGEELARVDNSGVLSGNPAQYIGGGTLPNDAIMGTSAWYKENEADEFMDQLTVRKQLKNHDLSIGYASGYSKTSLFTQGSFGYTTYEPNPRMLRVSVENPNESILALSDENGVSNYGGLFYVNAEAEVSQFGTFINDLWKVTEQINLDLGFRFETIKHKGSKDRFAPSAISGGVDNNVNTAYDNSVLVSTGEQDNFNFNYNYLSFSAGLNYMINDNTAVFTRFSKGNKAPELNYYFNNFSNVPINGEGQVQKIFQAELGLKSSFKNLSISTTLFSSALNDINVTNFEFDPDNNNIFYTPNQLNSSRTIGLEWESIYAPFQNFSFLFNGVVQDAAAKKWTVYDASGTVDTSDDSIQDFSGNTLAFNPSLMFNLGTEFQKDKISAFVKWQYMGKREGNIANAFQLAAYSTFNLGLGYEFTENLSANLLVTNLFNSEGLANFFGANSFGANANGATQSFINQNPDESFVVVPILPRGTLLKVSYMF